ncbi:MAG: HAD family hydrolase [Clostridiales bacterium]|nr:HAD family hydrolase [Clostridiales bacterium]
MNTFLFDLDGTLLPMDQDLFIKLYFKGLIKHLQPYHILPEDLISAVNYGTGAMVLNDGTISNEERFWSAFASKLGDDIRKLEPVFIDFYRTSFHEAKASTKTSPYTAKIINLLKQKGYDIIIATNPLFPQIATYNRIDWAGFSPSDVSYVTTYETCTYCKPNLAYYTEILDRMKKKPEDCMMVGNNVEEDMQVHKLGLARYLITDCLINENDTDISDILHGTMEQFYEFVESLPSIQ